jgi:site-specific recombinase XerD
MEEISAHYYSREVESEFLKKEFGGRGKGALGRWEKRKYYIVKALTQFLETETISYTHKERNELSFKGKLGESMSRFFQFFVQEYQFSEGYNARLKKDLFNFLRYCSERKIEKPEELTGHVVIEYFASGKVADQNATYSLRHYFKYLFQTQVLRINYASRIPKFKRKIQTLGSVYKPEEVEKIISSIDRSSNAGKRDYAIIVLAARLGMRISDIVNLKFTNFNWNLNEIFFTQQKTGVPNRLPLDVQVGNAIINYALSARPNSDDPHVFVRSVPPHVAYKSGLSIGTLIKGIFKKSGVPSNGRHRGGHSLRHSLAQTLMDAGVSMDRIMAILGHTTLESTNDYTRANLKLLSKYGLPVRRVYEGFYKQKGGKFYD